ncbi:MAG: FtsQ-type POTRA domain-containing protein [Acetobacteraceae bacterium]|nr:FtsQ-type POTRA domain-containing protein [Acetobacteraceae bacterium]MSP29388.1 FtsQ-type POTRA domain-containing protein [Acetobacteraceae bacterium]
MPRVKSAQRLSVQNRPGRMRLLLRRARRYSRLGLGVGAGMAVLLVGWLFLRPADPGTLLAGMQTRLTAGTANAGLRLRQIDIEGRVNTAEPLLRAAIGVHLDEAILSVSLTAMKARIETLSSVQSVVIERQLPDRLVVRLYEREPLAIWQNQGKFSLIDRAGRVVERDLAESQDLPLIVGAGAPQAAALMLDVLNRHPALLSRMVAAIRVGERRWNLRLQTGADVMLPEGHEDVAIARLMSLHQDQGLLDRPLKSIDLRLPDRLIIRPKPDATPDDATQPRGAPPRRPT